VQGGALMKYFHFSQNNSGGYFIINEVVAAHVIIQAEGAAEAYDKLLDITQEHSAYCECCGYRWPSYPADEDDDGTDEPTMWEEPIAEKPDAKIIIYHADGRIERTYEVEEDDDNG
jgi:hypothetical protein